MPARDPGVAKFGIALEWGSRGRWFESSHSDQEKGALQNSAKKTKAPAFPEKGVGWCLCLW